MRKKNADYSMPSLSFADMGNGDFKNAGQYISDEQDSTIS